MQRKAKSQQHFYPWVNSSKALRIYMISHITLLFPPPCATFKKGGREIIKRTVH